MLLLLLLLSRFSRVRLLATEKEKVVKRKAYCNLLNVLYLLFTLICLIMK